jgi:hypothetical protein
MNELRTILFKGADCHPYNVGSNHEIMIADLDHTVASVPARSVQVAYSLIPNHQHPLSGY